MNQEYYETISTLINKIQQDKEFSTAQYIRVLEIISKLNYTLRKIEKDNKNEVVV